MLFQQYPGWLTLRSELLQIDENATGLTLFSRPLLNWLAKHSGSPRYDWGVVNACAYSFLDLLSEKCYTPNDKSSTNYHGSSLIDYCLRCECYMRYILSERITQFIQKEAEKDGNRHGYLRFYSKNRIPGQSAFNWDVERSTPFLPQERVIPMKHIHDMIIEIDKMEFCTPASDVEI